MNFNITKRKNMFIDKIVVSEKSLHNYHFHDIVHSNIEYITKLFQKNIKDIYICEDALKSYYVDYYLSHIKHGGFFTFCKEIQENSKILYYVKEGLHSIGAKQHLELLETTLNSYNRKVKFLSLFDELFFEIQIKENLLKLNTEWLLKHPKIFAIEEKQMNKIVKKHIKSLGEEQRHTKIIQKLCDIANEEFIRVTVGDKRNIYNTSWYFKTTNGYYYMIEKDSKVTMYNSHTKKAVVRGKISNNSSLSKINYKSIFNRFLA